MKILTINTVLHGGGAAKIARTLYCSSNKTSQISNFFAYGRGKKNRDSQEDKQTWFRLGRADIKGYDTDR